MHLYIDIRIEFIKVNTSQLAAVGMVTKPT
jgi:hypothetical protein